MPKETASFNAGIGASLVGVEASAVVRYQHSYSQRTKPLFSPFNL